MTLQIRLLEKNDLRNGFLESISNLFKAGLDEQDAVIIFDKIRDNPVYRIFVAELGGEIVGATTLLVEQKFILNGARFAYIEDMAVRKGFEKQGIGMRLVEAAIEEAKRKGCLVVRLDCSDETIGFYTKAGFKKKQHVHRMQIDLRDIKQ
ncbi:MAG: GNAT family N-acetyltransferase [Pseudolabrys sp.]|nr:GNAT family N-acetyltransferase [Pseudolabrys sp.]